MVVPQKGSPPVSRKDFWLTLLVKTVESAILITQLSTLFSNGSPEYFCSCVSKDGHLISCEEGSSGALCEGIFYSTAEAVLVSSVAVSLLQMVLAMFSVPVHQLHFLGLSFFQSVAGIATSLVFYYWHFDSQGFGASEGIHPNSEFCVLPVLQLLYFVYCFYKTYNHVWPTTV